MRKTPLALGIVAVILGIALASLATIPVSRWTTFTVNEPDSELVLNDAFEIPPASNITRWVYLEAGVNVTINGAVSVPGSNRSIGATIDFSINNDSPVLLQNRTISPRVSSWTVPASANYSLVFDNSYDGASKDAIIMLQESWYGPHEYRVLVNRLLVDSRLLWVGLFSIGVGAGLLFYAIKKPITR
jgi:hypothetical protein